MKLEDLLRDLNLASDNNITVDGPVISNDLPSINKDEVIYIDQQLDWEDAVSICFLTISEVDLAFEIIR